MTTFQNLNQVSVIHFLLYSNKIQDINFQYINYNNIIYYAYYKIRIFLIQSKSKLFVLPILII